ncbi:Auxin transporter-like protein [Arachis hypogaea]|nr:Auxin transporter-like protein [Arachis hypogaea]
MSRQKQGGEETMMSSLNETIEREEREELEKKGGGSSSHSSLKSLPGMVVLLRILGSTVPQISWTAYLISILYVEYRTRKEKENVNFKNHVIQV